MLSILKTAIITIIISFISGVLLDYYKNLSPKIVLDIKKMKNKNIYLISVKNISNRIIHELNLNIQSKNEELSLDDIKITRGLKYDVENNEGYYDVSIPFLSKNDQLSLKVILSGSIKPVISLRSPEKFKQINKEKQYKNDNTMENKKSNFLKNVFFKNKKTAITTIIAAAAIFIVVFECDKVITNIKNKTVDIPAPENTTDIQNTKSTDNSSENNKVNKDSSDVKTPVKKESNDSQSKDKKNTSSNIQNSNVNNNDSNDKNTSISENKDTQNNDTKKSSTENSNEAGKDQKTKISEENGTSKGENTSK